MKGTTPTVYLASPVFREIADNARVSVRYKFMINKVWSNLKHRRSRHRGRQPVPERGGDTARGGAERCGLHRLPHRPPHHRGDRLHPQRQGRQHEQRRLEPYPPAPRCDRHQHARVLAGTTADYTISLILANLRNIVGLNNYVWSGQWAPGEKWDLDRHVTENTEPDLRHPRPGRNRPGGRATRGALGIHIAYHDIFQSTELEEKYPNLTCSRRRAAPRPPTSSRFTSRSTRTPALCRRAPLQLMQPPRSW